MKKRTFLTELIFWVVLLGADAALLFVCHRKYGDDYFVLDTMIPMVMFGIFLPLFAGAMRYLPKKKGLWALWLVIAVAAGIGIGQLILPKLYPSAYAVREAEAAYAAAKEAAVAAAAQDRAELAAVYTKIAGGEITREKAAPLPSGKVLFAGIYEDGTEGYKVSSTSMTAAVLGENYSGFPNAHLAKNFAEADFVVFSYTIQVENGTWVNTSNGTRRAAMWDRYYMVIWDVKNNVCSHEILLFSEEQRRSRKVTEYPTGKIAEWMGLLEAKTE